MKTPFSLVEHRRRPHPTLAPPPDHYFEQLPLRVRRRVRATPAPAPAEGWLAALAAPWRTAGAAVLLLGSFAAAFLLNPAPLARGPASLARVPHRELVHYLLAADQPISLTELAEFAGTARSIPSGANLQASPAEIQDLLDQQAADDEYL